MLADIILVAVGIAWVCAAAVFDIKTREVPDWLSFSMISLGLGIRIIYSAIFSDWLFFLYGLAGFGAALVVGLLFFYAHIWGGGDSKLLMGVGAVFGTAPFFITPSLPFFVVVLANILIFGSVYGLIWASVLFVRNCREVLAHASHVFRSTVYLRYALVALAVVSVAMIPLMREFFTKVFLVVAAVSFVLYYVLYVFIRALEDAVMCRRTPVSELAIGDWVCEDVVVRGKTICRRRDFGLTAEQIGQLNKHRVRFVMVKDGMAFVPAFVFGLVFSLGFGEILFMMF